MVIASAVLHTAPGNWFNMHTAIIECTQLIAVIRVIAAYVLTLRL